MNEWVCCRDCEALGHFLSEELASERTHPCGSSDWRVFSSLPGGLAKCHKNTSVLWPPRVALTAGGGVVVGGDRLNKCHSRIYCTRSSSASEQAHVSRRNTSLSVRGGGPSSRKAASRFLGEQG